jgi:hypothetical protein
VSYFRPQKAGKTGPRTITGLPNSTQKMSQEGGRVNTEKCARSNCLTVGVHSSARTIELSGEDAFAKPFAIRKNLVDVAGIEPATPCLQRRQQKSNKCCIWYRLHKIQGSQPPLELDRSRTDRRSNERWRVVFRLAFAPIHPERLIGMAVAASPGRVLSCAVGRKTEHNSSQNGFLLIGGRRSEAGSGVGGFSRGHVPPPGADCMESRWRQHGRWAPCRCHG